jgi:hypothetical protein
VPRYVAWLISSLIVDYFAFVARRRLLRLRLAPGCLSTSRGSSRGSSSITPCAKTSSCGHTGSTSATPCVATTCLAATLALLRVHRQLARQVGVIITTGRIRRTLVNKINLLVDSPRSIEASHLAPVKAESIFLRRESGCSGTSRGSSSTTSTTLCIRVPRHVARLVTRLVVDYFT